MKIIKQDGERRVFTLEDGSEASFDEYGKTTPTEKATKKTKKKTRKEKKLDLDNPIELADFKHGILNNPFETDG